MKFYIARSLHPLPVHPNILSNCQTAWEQIWKQKRCNIGNGGTSPGTCDTLAGSFSLLNSLRWTLWLLFANKITPPDGVASDIPKPTLNTKSIVTTAFKDDTSKGIVVASTEDHGELLAILIEHYVSGMSAVSPLNSLRTLLKNCVYAVSYLGCCSLQRLSNITIHTMTIGSAVQVAWGRGKMRWLLHNPVLTM